MFPFVAKELPRSPGCLSLQEKPTSAAPAVFLQGSSHTAAQRPVDPAGADLLAAPIVLTPVQPWK